MFVETIKNYDVSKENCYRSQYFTGCLFIMDLTKEMAMLESFKTLMVVICREGNTTNGESLKGYGFFQLEATKKKL